jgi:hypothetical protein
MGPRHDLNVSEITKAYTEGESAASIARRLNCSVWSIITRLNRAGVKVRPSVEQTARHLGDNGYPPNLGLVLETLEGVMLGDGSMDPKGCLRLTQRDSCVGWLNSLQVSLREWGCESTLHPLAARNYTPDIKGRLIKQGPANLLYTVCYREFKPQLERWYPRQGKKVVPRDLTLTPLSVAHWLCGDGMRNQGGIAFCTNSFSKEDVEYLVYLFFRDLGVHAHVRPVGSHRLGEYNVHITRRQEAYNLAKMVRPYLPNCFLYKVDTITAPTIVNKKLSALSVKEIRQSKLTPEELALKFDVSLASVCGVLDGTRYNHVK